MTAFRSRFWEAKCNSETLIVFHRVRFGHLNASESLISFNFLCAVLNSLQLDIGERSAYDVALGVADAFSMSAYMEGMVARPFSLLFEHCFIIDGRLRNSTTCRVQSRPSIQTAGRVFSLPYIPGLNSGTTQLFHKLPNLPTFRQTVHLSIQFLALIVPQVLIQFTP